MRTIFCFAAISMTALAHANVCTRLLGKVKAEGPQTLLRGAFYRQALALNLVESVAEKDLSADSKASTQHRLDVMTEALGRSAGKNVAKKQEFYREVLDILISSLETRAGEAVDSKLTGGQEVLIEWLSRNGLLMASQNSEVQRRLVNSIVKLKVGSNARRRISLERLLFDLASRPELRFTAESAHLFDVLPLEDKLALVNGSSETLNSWAKSNLKAWGPVVRLESVRRKITPWLDDFFASGHATSLLHWLDDARNGDTLALDGTLGYYDPRVMITSLAAQNNDKSVIKNPLHEVLYRLLKHRLEFGLQNSDRSESHELARRTPRFVEPATFATLVILSRLKTEGIARLSPEETAELRTILTSTPTSVQDHLETSLGLSPNFAVERFFDGHWDIDVLEGVSDSFSYVMRYNSGWRS